MKSRLIGSIIMLLVLKVTGCTDSVSVKIKQTIIDYETKENTGFQMVHIDSLTYSLSDSTVYYNHFLNSLAERSESFSKMARLKTNLAQSHVNNFLSADKKGNYSDDKNKNDLDKSLEDLQKNEREWNIINDSMDVMLNAVHRTDTLKKIFYKVSFSLNAVKANKIIIQKRKAILNRDDYRVVIYQ